MNLLFYAKIILNKWSEIALLWHLKEGDSRGITKKEIGWLWNFSVTQNTENEIFVVMGFLKKKIKNESLTWLGLKLIKLFLFLLIFLHALN